MPRIIIDGQEHDFADGTTLIQACEQAGVEIPRFCYHERLSIAGNCRMCLVEVVGGPPKPQASCALSVNDIRPGKGAAYAEVKTNSPMVKKAREGVMEFLLINHPLDCPICDQGGECDLQDQAMGYGIDTTRYIENKRAVVDKDIGPLVKTTMTRCIHCTRCVRFTTEVAGIEEMGATGRGEDMEITTYLEKALTSELQGNVIDLCPVGALTSRPYAFKSRPWELKKTESIDVMDALGSNIRIDARGREVLRVLPRNHDAVNEEWISDKTRYIVDGLGVQRLDQPYIRKNGRLVAASWDEALAVVADHFGAAKPERIGAIAGDLAGAEEMFALKGLMWQLGSPHMDCRQDGAKLDPALGRASYLFNPGVAAIEQADVILIVGSNPRAESPVLNARIRKRARMGGVKIGLIGQAVDLTYRLEHLGAGPGTLAAVVGGQGSFGAALLAAKKPLVIVGQAALSRPDGQQVLALAARAALASPNRDPVWNGLAVMHTAAARVAGLDLGFVPGTNGRDTNGIVEGARKGEFDVVYLLGADEIETTRLGKAFVVYQGTHGDRGAHRADVILPGAAYTEKSATYVNTEGRAQMTARAVFPPGDAKEDWAILRALSAAAGKVLPFDTLAELRKAMLTYYPSFGRIDRIAPAAPEELAKVAQGGGEVVDSTFGLAIGDFFLTNPIARASAVMAELSAMRAGQALKAAE